MIIKTIGKDGIKEITGKIITYKNTKFGIPFKKENPGFEFTHITSGTGFNGNGKRNMESLKSVEKRIGIRKFWKTIKSQKTIEDILKEKKAIEEHNTLFHDKVKLLEKITGLKFKKDNRISFITGKLCINIFDLEDQLKNMGYNDNGVSMNDFITKKWNKEISQKINELI